MMTLFWKGGKVEAVWVDEDATLPLTNAYPLHTVKRKAPNGDTILFREPEPPDYDELSEKIYNVIVSEPKKPSRIMYVFLCVITFDIYASWYRRRMSEYQKQSSMLFTLIDRYNLK